MKVLDRDTRTARTQPDQPHYPLMGSLLVIILERDGSLHHYPPGRPPAPLSQTQQADQAQPGMIERLLGLTFGRLKISNMEMRTNDQSKG